MDSEQATAVLDFAKTLVNSNKKQCTAILLHMSPKQCRILREMALNLLLNDSVHIPEKEKKYLKRNAAKIKLIASRKVCAADKKQIVIKNQRMIKRIANVVIGYLAN